jgi:DNA (cytosine-5)-methyltransferase 1
MSIEAISLFSGCGGFDFGVQKAGAKITWANDNDPHAASAYQSIFKDTEFINRDIREIRKFPQAEILIGCYPCTGFSEASRRKWKNRKSRDLHKNDKNFLFKEFLRALKIVRPKFLFVENVKGMLSAGDGWFIREQVRAFTHLGYRVKFSQVDSSDFGVAQTRKRIFLVGTHKSIKDFEYSFPIPSHGESKRFPIWTLKDVIGDLPKWPKGEFFDFRFHGHYLTRNRKRGWNEPSFTIVADAHHIPLHPGGKPMLFVSKDNWRLQGEFNRRLSWRECARIQGLPRRLEIEGTLMDKYRVVGNSVPPRLSEVIVRPVLNYLRSA